MPKQTIINKAIRRFEQQAKRDTSLYLGRAIVPALPENHYAIFFNGRFQSLEKGSGDYYEGY